MWRDEQGWKPKQKPMRFQLQVLSHVGFLHFSPHKHGHQGYPLQDPLTQISINKLRWNISCSVSSHRYFEKKKKSWHFQGWLFSLCSRIKRESDSLGWKLALQGHLRPSFTLKEGREPEEEPCFNLWPGQGRLSRFGIVADHQSAKLNWMCIFSQPLVFFDMLLRLSDPAGDACALGLNSLAVILALLWPYWRIVMAL